MTTFIDLCKEGDLDKIKTYYNENTVNINSENEEAFREACKCGLDVAQW